MLKPVSVVLLVSFAIWPSLVSARGGHFGGGYGGGLGGGFGMHGHGLRLPGDRRMSRPAAEASTYVAIEMTVSADPATLPATTTKLTESLPAFNGRIVANDASPRSVDGISPTTFILVAFGTLEDAEHWKMSEPFKAFEADARKASARIFTVDAVRSAPLAERQDPHRKTEDRAYQKLIEGGDRTLKKIQDICSHC